MKAVSDSETGLVRCAIDELLERYVSWREECQAVTTAYRWWAYARRGERLLAYAGYLAALDREEVAANLYSKHIEHVRRITA
jgi:hypothetical protein